MNKYLILALSVVVLATVILAGYLVLASKWGFNLNRQTQNTQNSSPKTTSIPSENITLTSSGFQPQTLKTRVGTRVVWLNKSGTVGSVNSDNYPTNLLHPFLNLGQFKDGSSFSTVFDKPGTYTYYNFSNRNQTGKIIVE